MMDPVNTRWQKDNDSQSSKVALSEKKVSNCPPKKWKTMQKWYNIIYNTVLTTRITDISPKWLFRCVWDRAAVATVTPERHSKPSAALAIWNLSKQETVETQLGSFAANETLFTLSFKFNKPEEKKRWTGSWTLLWDGRDYIWGCM